ncbi:hypothetical protein BH09MYX1_BH09MYX1_36750 [soil metagenome]
MPSACVAVAGKGIAPPASGAMVTTLKGAVTPKKRRSPLPVAPEMDEPLLPKSPPAYSFAPRGLLNAVQRDNAPE